MKVRDQVIFGAAAISMVLCTTVSMADNVAPLPAGGPAAQSEAGGITPGTIIAVGGVLLAATVAGLVVINSDSNTPSSLPTISTVPAPGTTQTTSTSGT
jgi:hypothetical protein